MISEFLSNRIISQLPFVPNEGQRALLLKWGEFLSSHEPKKVFLLRGYAGTGKTSMVSALVKALHSLQQPCVLLAPTGRAAKVLARYSGFPAYTIHKRIYRQERLGEYKFSLADNLLRNGLFIVDEASMIANASADSAFGSGRLLDDLIRYVYSSDRCSMLILGDDAQLPPVGQSLSPALQAKRLEGYGLTVTEHVLTEVARQALDSGILKNATEIRRKIQDDDFVHSFSFAPSADVIPLEGVNLLEPLEQSFREVGIEETLFVTRTNYRTNLYNNGVRAQILFREDSLSTGDRIMVVQNNYFWTEKYECLDFLANGDILEIERIRNQREMYGFHFADVSLRSVDYDWEIDAVLWTDTLLSATPDEHRQMRQTLYERIAEDYPEVKNKKDLVKLIYENPYFNAIQARFAYAVTCHKAQGGQWKHVYIDRGNLSEDQFDKEYYRWLYTAVTRATEKVFLVNFH